jgi:hypothetical protein
LNDKIIEKSLNCEIYKSQSDLGGSVNDKHNRHELDFTIWMVELDNRYQDWLAKKAIDQKEYFIRSNVRACDKVFRTLPTRCAAPGCGYPLRTDGLHDRLPLYGDVCNLCYFMYHLVLARNWFVEAHREDQERQKKQKWDDRGNK